jgi:hypothetical protein
MTVIMVIACLISIQVGTHSQGKSCKTNEADPWQGTPQTYNLKLDNLTWFEGLSFEPYFT